MRIVFMGTPDFAVASLQALKEANFDIVAVVTAPDKPAGRGQKLNESAVKKYAQFLELPILQPQKLKDPAFIQELEALHADLFVVVAFRMLPEVVWNMPPKGTINLHGSLLPQYRGAAPIHHAVMNGETETGVTTFRLTHEIDTGNMLFSDKIPIGPEDNTGQVHDRLMATGARLLVKTVKAIESNDFIEQPQPELTDLKHAPKIFREFCKIDWDQDTISIYNFIRGLSPYPVAYTEWKDKNLKIYKASMEIRQHGYSPGETETDGKTFLKFATRDGFILVSDVQYEGKKRMLTEDFLRGFRH